MLILTPNGVEEMAHRIYNMPKYRGVQVPVETIRALIIECIPLSNNLRDLEKEVRGKLHNIVALYLGDLDYSAATVEFLLIKNDPSAIREFSLRALMFHASTKERGRELASLYQLLFKRIGKASSIADLACGLHPLGLPFMDLPSGTAYYAYDLNKTRVDFLNMYIRELGYMGGCFHKDILLNPPPEKFDIAFFFKEAHRFEKRKPGATIKLIDKIMAPKVVVSLPLQSLKTRNNIFSKYEIILARHADERGWSFERTDFGNEAFYIIGKNTEGWQG